MGYNIGDKCKITKNLLSSSCIGDIVTIIEIHTSIENKPFYTIEFEDGLKGYASENCLKPIES